MIEVEIKFDPADPGLPRLLADSQLVSEKTNTDTYFDTTDYQLTTQDIWLRLRNQQFELKLPQNASDITERVSDQYEEIENAAEIEKRLAELGFTTKLAELTAAGVRPFVTIITSRKTYQNEEFKIDIDQMNFDYQQAEVELMIPNADSRGAAEQRIVEFLKKYNIVPRYRLGKNKEYLRRFSPDHYHALVKAGVVRPS